MLMKEDVEGWNKVFADCQIKQSDLTQPTEGFLTKALVCYTRRFGYKVEPPFALNGENVENSRENRLFLVSLARQIDHFLKITDKSYAFTYFDLIRPTPKKTAHTLYILLNYLFYYNMYKEEVFKMANEPIQKFHEIKSLIERQQRENDLKIQEAKKLKVTVDELLKELPCLRSEHKETSKKKLAQDEVVNKLKEACDELGEKLKHLHEQKRGLLKRVVADEESRELQKQIENLKDDITKHKELGSSNECAFRELHENVELMQNLKKEIEKAADIMPLRLLDQLNDSNKQLQKAMEDEHSAEERQTLLTNQIEAEQQNYESLEQQYKARKQEFESMEKDHNKTLKNFHKSLKQKSEQAEQCQAQDQALDCQVEEQSDIAEYLKENIAEIIGIYEATSK